jgi:hypothetical protein
MDSPRSADGVLLVPSHAGELVHQMALAEQWLVPRGVVVVVPCESENDTLPMLLVFLARGGSWRLVHTLDWASGRRSAPHVSGDPLVLNETRVRAYVLSRSPDPLIVADQCASGHFLVRDATLQLREHLAADRRAAALRAIARRYWDAGSNVFVPFDDVAQKALYDAGAMPFVLDDTALTPSPAQEL